MQGSTRIKLLDNRLANQIAAGEVVERPSSVVKELIENSIDAGSSRVEVEVERGGTRLIRITDDGQGIEKDDLELALTRHATSKIQSSNDLANIRSLGFRGEALASISAVSRLTLTSRAKNAELAWQAVAQGRDMAVEISPAAATQGTRIEVADLFYNTPARQKFLRTEKTEFNHVEEIFKRHALANFGVALVLKHNHKVVKRVLAVGQAGQYLRRVATVCGKPFAEHAQAFNCSYDAIKLWGWLGRPQFHRSESDIQYIFVNGRPVKDKTLNHAVRQAYDGLLPAGRMATYVVYLELDPCHVDVNVHPTKHEVRFSQQRLVHDLLAKSVRETLMTCLGSRPSSGSLGGQAGTKGPDKIVASESDSAASVMNQQVLAPTVSGAAGSFASVRQLNEPSPGYENRVSNFVDLPSERGGEKRPLQTNNPNPLVLRSASLKNYSSSLVRQVAQGFTQSDEPPEKNDFLMSIDKNYWLFSATSQAKNQAGNACNCLVYAIDAAKLFRNYMMMLLTAEKKAASKALLFPKLLSIESSLLEDFSVHQIIQCLGFEFSPTSPSQIEINKIPVWMQQFDSQIIYDKLPDCLVDFQHSLDHEGIATEFSRLIAPISQALMLFLCQQMQSQFNSLAACRLVEGEFLAGLFQ